MRQPETIKQMGKSVNNLTLVVFWALLLCLIPKIGLGFQKSTADKEMYSIIRSSFQYSNEKRIIIHTKTMAYEGWMHDLWSKEIFGKEGVGFCVFPNAQLKEAFGELRFKVKSLTSKRLFKNMLEDRFILKSNEKAEGILILAEPIIIGEYSFLFRKTKSTKSLYVQKMDPNGKWDYECGVTIYGELH